MTYRFGLADKPALSEVGDKSLSLTRMTKAELAVPLATAGNTTPARSNR